MDTSAPTPPPATTIHACTLDGVAQQRECWLLITSPTQPRSGAGNAVFGLAWKAAQALGQPLRILTDSAAAETAAKTVYSAYPGLSFSRTDRDSAPSAPPPTALFHPLSPTEAHTAWKELRTHWQLPTSPAPYLCPKPYDSEGPAAHRLSEAMLASERNTPSQTPEPRLLLTLAAPSALALKEATTALSRLLERLPQCSIMLCTSPRTAQLEPQLLRHFTHTLSAQLDNARAGGKTVAFYQYDIASRTLQDQPGLPVTDAATHTHTKNRYTRMLAHADAVVVLGDSWSMASEAALTGAPVYLGGFNDTPAFLANAAGRIGEDEATRYRPMRDLATFTPGTRYTPLDVTAHHVEECLHNLARHQSRESVPR